MTEFTKENAKPQATDLNQTVILKSEVDNLVARITELEQKLADQAATTARISQLELKLAQNQLVAATPAAPQAGNSFRTSRRKLLKGMGVAAAGLAASATAFASQGSQQANAASGDYLILGNSNLASDATYLSQTGTNPTDGAILWADWNPSDKSAAPNVEAGLAGTSSTGIGGYFQGAKAPILLKPAASGTGAPASGNHSKGELYVDSAGDLFLCQSSGTPGDWVKVNGGTLTLAGDIGGTTSTPKVVGLQGTALSNTAPSSGQVLTYDGTNWTPGTGIPLAGDIGGTSATPKVVGLQGQSVSTSTPSNGQVLTYNGTNWSPATPSSGGGSSGSYVSLQSTTPGTADTGNLNVSGTVRTGGSGGIGGYFSGSTAPILLNPSASSGAPTSGSHSKGELYVDSVGDLYICQSNGTPGTWVKVNGGSGGGGGVSSVAVTAPIINSGTSTAPNIGLNITTDNDGGAIVKQTSFPGIRQTADINITGVINGNSAVQAGGLNLNPTPKNWVMNGNFDISQRYGPLCSVVVPNAATYVIDRWFTLRDGDNATVRVKHMAFAQGQTDVTGEPTYYFRFEQSVAGSNGNYNHIIHSIEDVRTLASQTWSASFWAKADSTRQVEFFPTLYFGAGSGGRYDSNSTTFTLSTSWEKFTANGTMPGISGITLGAGHCTQLSFTLKAMNTVQTIDIAQVQFEPGSYDSPFQKKSFGEELEACKRYYQKSFPYATAAAQNTGVTNGTFRWPASKTNASTNYSSSFSLPVQMRTSPTVTLYNPNAANAQVYNTDRTNSGTSTAATSGIVSESVLGFNTTGVSGWAVGDRLSLHWAADAELYF